MCVIVISFRGLSVLGRCIWPCNALFLCLGFWLPWWFSFRVRLQLSEYSFQRWMQRIFSLVVKDGKTPKTSNHSTITLGTIVSLIDLTARRNMCSSSRRGCSNKMMFKIWRRIWWNSSPCPMSYCYLINCKSRTICLP